MKDILTTALATMSAEGNAYVQMIVDGKIVSLPDTPQGIAWAVRIQDVLLASEGITAGICCPEQGRLAIAYWDDAIYTQD